MLTQEQEIDSIYEGMNGYGMFPTKHPKTYLNKAYAAGVAAGEAKERERCVKIADKRAEALTSLAELQKNNASIPTVLTNREDAQFFTEGGISASRRIAQHIRELKERK